LKKAMFNYIMILCQILERCSVSIEQV